MTKLHWKLWTLCRGRNRCVTNFAVGNGAPLTVKQCLFLILHSFTALHFKLACFWSVINHWEISVQFICKFNEQPQKLWEKICLCRDNVLPPPNYEGSILSFSTLNHSTNVFHWVSVITECAYITLRLGKEEPTSLINQSSSPLAPHLLRTLGLTLSW